MSVEYRPRRPPRIFAVIVALVAAGYLYGGVQLAGLGGTIYYAFAGAALLMTSVLLWMGSRWSSRLFGALLLVTLIWGLREAGADVWSLLPRWWLLALIGLWFLTPFVRRGLHSPNPPPPLFGSVTSKAVSVGVAAILVGVAVAATRSNDEVASRASNTAASVEPTDWQHYGNTTHGTRFVRSAQITPDNVGQLKKVWHVRTKRSGQFKATPLQVGDLLYVCTAMNVVIAVDAESGEKRWEFDPELKVPPVGFNTTCRGVSYHKAPESYAGACPARIIMGTTDARLMALNALTGERCADFGVNGEVNLQKGIGDVKPSMYFVTSPPLIARDRIVVGTRVADNFEVDEPSGVIRAFDAVSGAFVWAWDMGRPGINTEPAEGEQYTRGTPNVWSMMSFDDSLGLIYAPTGNSTPDFFGAHRSEVSEKFSSAVVALDVNDGSLRWHYQTVHHDIWDYDAPSQPALIDVPQENGEVIPALVQTTKRSEIFLLDRRTGTPIAEVVEKPVPQNPAQGEWVAKTQPFSVGMPEFRGPDLTDADMWGITPFDHMWCRIAFKKMRYEGHFTPPSVQGTLQYPGNAGGFNWGSVAIDENNHYMVATLLNLGSRVKLVPRAEVPQDRKRYLQLGTPYAVDVMPFMSPLAVPCTKPPYGRMVMVDLQTRQTVWDEAIGMTNEMGPLGTKIGLELPIGAPLSAGSIVTQGGLVFFGGSMDRYFRAIDVRTGKELWRDFLPGSAHATPMSYVSPQTKRQIVVITVPNLQRRYGMAGEAPDDVDPEGGHIIAYALN